jgi:hypothetical protein
MRALILIAALAAAPTAQAATAADVARLAWIGGAWTQARDGGTVRETWTPPLDGAMAGTTVTVRPGRKPFIEFAKITLEPAGVTYTAYVGGQPPTAFVLLPGGDGEAVFENKAHDFPQRVFYRRCGADLCAGIEGTMNGKPAKQAWRYMRVR